MAQDTVLVTLKNYRCFADSEPARLRIQAGVLAFVGPNNSGKSSLLRFFMSSDRYLEHSGIANR